MRDYTSETYGDKLADEYDVVHPDGPDVPAAVTFLAERAGTGPVLELGIGTGRIAIPLAAQGIEVHGIESSQRMIEKLKEKPGGDSITVSLGDMADVVAARDAYSVVFTTFNTFWMLLTQDDQIRCMRNAAQRLTDDGVLVIEGTVPDPSGLGQTRTVVPLSISGTHARIDIVLRDPVTQRIDRQVLIIDESGFRLRPLALRYVWPTEQDLMARLAGLRLRERFADWNGAAVTQKSHGCVSVYEKAPS